MEEFERLRLTRMWHGGRKDADAVQMVCRRAPRTGATDLPFVKKQCRSVIKPSAVKRIMPASR